MQKSRLQEADAALAAIIETRFSGRGEFSANCSPSLRRRNARPPVSRTTWQGSAERTKLQRLTAPVDGVVQQFAVHTIGGVVTPAQTLAVLVPADAGSKSKRWSPNRDIGFVHPGQDAQIKIDTFNFTRYGLLHGHVVSVSPDAIVRETPQDRGNNMAKGADNETSEPKGQEYIYSARISLDQTKIQVDDLVANLSPGMAVTVEIRTGSRAVISYLLSPLLRYKHDSMRER